MQLSSSSSFSVRYVLDQVGFPHPRSPLRHERTFSLVLQIALPHVADDVVLVLPGHSAVAIGSTLPFWPARPAPALSGSHSNPSACRLIAGSMHFLTSSSAAAARCKLVDDHFKQIFRDKINALLNVKTTISHSVLAKALVIGITRFSVYGQLFLSAVVFTFRVKSLF